MSIHPFHRSSRWSCVLPLSSQMKQRSVVLLVEWVAIHVAVFTLAAVGVAAWLVLVLP